MGGMNRDPKELLRKALEETGTSFAEVERSLGVGNGVVGRWVIGSRRPEHHLRLALEALFGIPAESWLTDEERALVERAKGAA